MSAKFVNKTLDQKLLDLGIFSSQYEKTIVMFKISTLEFIKNEFLTNTVNCCIWSAFSEGPGWGPAPLYNVCRVYVIQ